MMADVDDRQAGGDGAVCPCYRYREQKGDLKKMTFRTMDLSKEQLWRRGAGRCILMEKLSKRS